MKVELPTRSSADPASGSLVPPLGHVQKQWLPLLSLLFLLVLLMGVAEQLASTVADQKAVQPIPRSALKHTR